MFLTVLEGNQVDSSTRHDFVVYRFPKYTMLIKNININQELRGMMQERRISKSDRRQRTEKLPLSDTEGVSVILERRYFPDRRKSHYDPKW